MMHPPTTRLKNRPIGQNQPSEAAQNRPPLTYPATKRTPMLLSERHTTSQLRRTPALRASARTNQSGTSMLSSKSSFAPAAETFVMKHGAITDRSEEAT